MADLNTTISDILGITYTGTPDYPVLAAEAVLAAAAARGCNPLLAEEPLLTTVKAWLAAHFYAVANPKTVSRTINGVSKTVEVPSAADGLRATRYGRQAILLDGTGCLEAVSGRKMAVTWLGTEYDD